jgi:hypothetical protein
VIVYHAIAFWIPGLGGVFAYLRLRPRLLSAGAEASAELEPAAESFTSMAAR